MNEEEKKPIHRNEEESTHRNMPVPFSGEYAEFYLEHQFQRGSIIWDLFFNPRREVNEFGFIPLSVMDDGFSPSEKPSTQLVNYTISIIPENIQKLQDDVAKLINSRIEDAISSGRPNPLPEQTINLEDAIKMLENSLKERRENDPLLKKGIKEDWVCVLPPQFLSKVQELIAESQSSLNGFHSFFDIETFMGRNTHVRDTVSGNIEYLSPDYFELIYGTNFFLKKLIMEKLRKESPNSDSPEGENTED